MVGSCEHGGPQRRMRLLARLRQHVAEREVEVRAVVLDAAVAEHRDQAAHRILADRPLLVEANLERRQLGDQGALAHAELDAAVRDQIQRGDLLGHLGRMVGGQLEDAVAEPDALGALAGGGEEDLRRGGVRVFLQEVVLDFPGVVVAERVGELELGEGVLIELVLAVRPPRPRATAARRRCRTSSEWSPHRVLLDRGSEAGREPYRAKARARPAPRRRFWTPGPKSGGRRPWRSRG